MIQVLWHVLFVLLDFSVHRPRRKLRIRVEMELIPPVMPPHAPFAHKVMSFPASMFYRCNVIRTGYFCPSRTQAIETPCPTGTYSLGGQSSCTRCPAGHACDTAGRNIIPCAVGSYANEGLFPCFCPLMPSELTSQGMESVLLVRLALNVLTLLFQLKYSASQGRMLLLAVLLVLRALLEGIVPIPTRV
jgi:hypothetical protein